MMKVLSPGMQHHQKTDPGAEVLGVGGDLQQALGRCMEENAINHSLVPQRQRRDQLRHGEDHMKVLDRQQFRSTVFKPLRSGLSMTLRAMAIAARAICNFAVAAPIALLNMTAERRCAADRNCPQRLLLLMTERVPKRRQVSRAVEAENFAQLQRRRFHRPGVGCVGSGNRSNGLTVVRTARFETCRYLAVVLRLRCPSRT